MTCSLSNDGIQNSIISATFYLHKTVHDVRADGAVFLAEGDLDESYQREFFRTTVNVAKIFKGFRGNIILKPFIDSILKALNFDLNFPIEKGIYEMKNWTMPGAYLPPLMKTRFLMEVRYWVKTTAKNTKKWTFGTLFKNYGRLT